MSDMDWYQNIPVLGSMSLEHAANKLRELGDDESALALEIAHAESLRERASYDLGASIWPFQDRAWQYSAHAFGYMGPMVDNNKTLPIKHAGSINADPSLKNSRITITLDRLRVANYPGGGTHQILFDFYAQNQLVDKAEDLHFNATYRVREGQHAAIIGYPIFVGLNVGSIGAMFKCYTVNVKNDDDEALLSFLESDIFKAGLKLATTTQPALGPLSQLTLGVTRSIASRRKNVPVQEFYMGLDFSSIPTRARLAEGSYIVVQIPDRDEIRWNWDEWEYNCSVGQIVNKRHPTEAIPYNYIVFSVTKFLND